MWRRLEMRRSSRVLVQRETTIVTRITANPAITLETETVILPKVNCLVRYSQMRAIIAAESCSNKTFIAPSITANLLQKRCNHQNFSKDRKKVSLTRYSGLTKMTDQLARHRKRMLKQQKPYEIA